MPQSFDEWLQIGIIRGFIGAPICYTHDGLPTTLEEDDAWEEGDDPCIHILRLYHDEKQRQDVEANHSPSKWRNPYHYGNDN